MFRRKSAPAGPITGSAATGCSGGGGGGAAGLGRIRRTQSTPSYRRPKIKGVMKFVTADDSLHSTYGESKSDTSPENNSSGSNMVKKGIAFQYIEIREYNRTVGDNPSCSSGPPVTISWEYNPDTKIISVDQYEATRPTRRTHFEMILPRDLRQQMLRKEWDVTQNQIAAAIRSNIKVKNQRRQTVNNLGRSTKVEEAVESASRTVLRGLMLGTSTDKQVAKLEKQMQEAERARKQALLEAEMVGEYDQDDDDDHEETEASLMEDRFVACEATTPKGSKQVLPQVAPRRPESPKSPTKQQQQQEQNPLAGQDSMPRQPPRPQQSPLQARKPPVVEAEEEEKYEEKKQESIVAPPPLQSPNQKEGLPRHAMPVVVIEEESSDSEEDAHHHKHAANPQETSVGFEEGEKLPTELLVKTPSHSPPLPPPPPMKMPLTNGTNKTAAVSSPPPPPPPSFPDKKVHNTKEIPKVEEDSDDEVFEV